MRARRVVTAAADNGGNGASWRDAAGSGAGGAAASRADLTASLLSALAAQVRGGVVVMLCVDWGVTFMIS